MGPTDKAPGVELVINRARKQGTAEKGQEGVPGRPADHRLRGDRKQLSWAAGEMLSSESRAEVRRAGDPRGVTRAAYAGRDRRPAEKRASEDETVRWHH